MACAAPALLAGLALVAPASLAHQPRWSNEGLVEVDVHVDGRDAPLYPAPDGSGRLYLEARKGKSYDIVLRNRSAERLGVALVVDGLNVVSGERSEAHAPRNRMYILAPWGATSVRGWRTSLSEVRRFQFVDEQASYAARSGKASGKLGWIEVGVFRERRGWVEGPVPVQPGEPQDRDVRKPAPSDAPAPEARSEAQRNTREAADAMDSSRAARAYPGTGWGPEAYDPARVVQFDPMPTPAQLTTVRYEYAPALRALGILPQPWWSPDRLHERERGQEGFARPPAW